MILTKALSIKNNNKKNQTIFSSPSLHSLYLIKKADWMCSVWIQLFLESHTVALLLFDFHLLVCQLRHLAHWNEMLQKTKNKKKNLTVFIPRCDHDIKKNCYSKVLINSSEYNIAQIALIEYTEGNTANAKGITGARFKRKLLITLSKVSCILLVYKQKLIGNWNQSFRF